MELDVERLLGAVERSVSSLERDGRDARAVTVARGYGTTVEDLWDAVTRAERIARWFLPVSGRLELGGRFQLEGNAGGTITHCERPSYLGVTWEFGGDVSWVEARLSGVGPLADIRSRRRRRRLGDGPAGHGTASCGAERTEAGCGDVPHDS